MKNMCKKTSETSAGQSLMGVDSVCRTMQGLKICARKQAKPAPDRAGCAGVAVDSVCRTMQGRETRGRRQAKPEPDRARW
jgi:hypothetical protein